MALLDYSKAYDRTWRERLLAKMLDMGVPITMVGCRILAHPDGTSADERDI